MASRKNNNKRTSFSLVRDMPLNYRKPSLATQKITESDEHGVLMLNQQIDGWLRKRRAEMRHDASDGHVQIDAIETLLATTPWLKLSRAELTKWLNIIKDAQHKHDEQTQHPSVVAAHDATSFMANAAFEALTALISGRLSQDLYDSKFAALRKRFSDFDANDDGVIQIEELVIVLVSLDVFIPYDVLKDIIEAIDLEHNGMISLFEFVLLNGEIKRRMHLLHGETDSIVQNATSRRQLAVLDGIFAGTGGDVKEIASANYKRKESAYDQHEAELVVDGIVETFDMLLLPPRIEDITGCCVENRTELGHILHQPLFESVVVSLLLLDVVVVFVELLFLEGSLFGRGEDAEKAEHVLHNLGLTIIVFFCMEIALHIYAFGTDFFIGKFPVAGSFGDDAPSRPASKYNGVPMTEPTDHKDDKEQFTYKTRVMNVVDFIIVPTSLALELLIPAVGRFLIVIRMWRILRIVHGVWMSKAKHQKQKNEKKMEKLASTYLNQMDVIVSHYSAIIDDMEEEAHERVACLKDHLLGAARRRTQAHASTVSPELRHASRMAKFDVSIVLAARQALLSTLHLASDTPCVVVGQAAIYCWGLRRDFERVDFIIPSLTSNRVEETLQVAGRTLPVTALQTSIFDEDEHLLASAVHDRDGLLVAPVAYLAVEFQSQVCGSQEQQDIHL